jgi:hypothetical protein
VPQASVFPSPPEPSFDDAPSFVYTLTVAGRCVAWVHVAGELDLLTSQQLFVDR